MKVMNAYSFTMKQLILLFTLQILVPLKIIGQNVGIGTTEPAAKVHVHDGGLLIDGTTGSTPSQGSGTRLMWIPAKGAFRAGVAVGLVWDDAHIGIRSFVGGGTGNSASGLESFAGGGTNNSATGVQSFAGGGISNSATGAQSFVGGGNTNSALESLSFVGGGLSNIASGTRSFVGGGNHNTASGFGSFIGGSSNSVASGTYSVSCGGSVHTVSGFGAFVGGGNNNTASNSSVFVAGGANNIASGFTSFTGGGFHLFARSGFEAVFGSYSTDYVPNAINGWNGSDRLFVIANGTSDANRSNAVTVLKNGNTGIGTEMPRKALSIGDHLDLYSGAASNPTRPSIRASSADNLVLNAFGDGTVFINNDGGTGGVRFHNGSSGTANELMRITGSGWLGIGTASPHSILSIRSINDSVDGPIITLGGNSANQFESGRIRFFDGTSGTNWRGAYIHYAGTNDRLHIGVHDATNNDIADDINVISIVRSTGQVGIGTQNPAHPLHMSSGAHCTTAGVWTNASDLRLKDDVLPLHYGLAEVLALNPVQYRMIGDGSAQIGLIAQEVLQLIPEVISGSEGDIGDGHILGISYGNLTALLIRGMQQQQEIIAEQQKQIDHINAQIQTLIMQMEMRPVSGIQAQR